MTAAKRRTKPLTVTVEQMRFSGVLKGPVRAIHPAIKRVGCAWQFEPRTHAYKVPLQALDRVLVELEMAGHAVQVQMPGWS